MGAVRQTHPAQHLVDACLERGPAQTIQVPLMPQVFRGRQLHINTLRLKNHTDVTANGIRISSDINVQNGRPATKRNHQCGENSKEGSLAAAVWAQKAEQFGCLHVKRDAIQSGTFTVAVNQVLNGNNRRANRGADGRRWEGWRS